MLREAFIFKKSVTFVTLGGEVKIGLRYTFQKGIMTV